MKLYRIAKNYDEKKKLSEISEFDVGGQNNNFTNNFYNRSATIIVKTEMVDNKNHTFHEPLRDYLENFDLEKSTPGQKNHLYRTLMAYITNTSVDTRESILEEVRLNYYPDKPSRRKCIFLSDEKSLDTWFEYLKADENSQIYEFEVRDDVFCSTDKLLPPTYLWNGKQFELAHNYWNPTEEDLKDATDVEYLYEGHVKVLRRVK